MDIETNKIYMNYHELGELADKCFIGNASSVSSLNVASDCVSAERG